MTELSDDEWFKMWKNKQYASKIQDIWANDNGILHISLNFIQSGSIIIGTKEEIVKIHEQHIAEYLEEHHLTYLNNVWFKISFTEIRNHEISWIITERKVLQYNKEK